MFKSRSYANVTSTLALVIALGGTGFAAAGLAHHSVGTAQLKNGAVTAKKLHGAAVTGKKVKPRSLLAKDLKAGQGMPVAYAYVKADGTVDPAQSKGVTSANVTLESTSAFCFKGLTFPVRSAVATEDYDSVSGVTGAASFTTGNPEDDCASASTQAEVATTSNDTFAPAAFFIVFY
jgi:hypothetical protein